MNDYPQSKGRYPLLEDNLRFIKDHEEEIAEQFDRRNPAAIALVGEIQNINRAARITWLKPSEIDGFNEAVRLYRLLQS